MSFASSRVWALQQVFRGIKNAKGVFFLALMLASLSLTIPVFVASVLSTTTKSTNSTNSEIPTVITGCFQRNAVRCGRRWLPPHPR